MVKTSDFSVKVLGTSFNVNSYEDETFSHVTLKSGKVEFLRQNECIVLRPGEQVYVNNGQLETKKVDVDVYTAWMGNSFKFDKASIDVIMRQLVRWYGVHVFYMNEAVKKYHFKGTLPKYAKIEDVLNLLSETTDINFDIQGNTVVVYKDYKQ